MYLIKRKYAVKTKKIKNTKKLTMENTNTLDLITGGIALLILIGGMLMMFTTIFTTKNK